MALKNGKPNPLNFFKLRRVEFACPHFKYMTIDRYHPAQVRNIDQWIKSNLNNRYYLGKHVVLDSQNTIVYHLRIGFESEKEISFFTIACPHIHTR
jgi:hypothetical protein